MTQRFFPVIGGAEKVAETLMNYLSQQHQVAVYTSDAFDLNCFWDPKAKHIGPVIEDKKYPVNRYSIRTPQSIQNNQLNIPFIANSPGPFCPDMWKNLMNIQEKYDILITTALPYSHNIPAFIASKNNKIPLIVIPHLHLEYPELYLTGLWITILANSDIVIVNTQAEKQSLLKYSIPDEKIHVITPGIDIQERREGRDLRKELDIDKNSLLVLFVGSKSYDKGAINLIEALKSRWNKSSKIDLVLVGSSMPDFEDYMSKLDTKFQRHIHNLGVVSDELKEDAFYSCDVFALPSKSESFGITYLEAWKYKKPVIGCTIKAIREIIDNDVNGLLVDFGNIDELTNTIKKLEDPSLRKTLGENGFKNLVEKYDLRTIYQKFENLFLSLA